MSISRETYIDYDAVMQAPIHRVFAEPDTQKRRTAIREIYAENVQVYEPGVEASGYEGIEQVVNEVLSQAPPGFVFGTFGPAVGHHGVGRLRWHFGPQEGPPAITGLDVVEIVDGKIARLYVFLDPVPA